MIQKVEEVLGFVVGASHGADDIPVLVQQYEIWDATCETGRTEVFCEAFPFLLIHIEDKDVEIFQGLYYSTSFQHFILHVLAWTAPLG